MKKKILITGANRGIGFALTKLCLSKDLYVEACCRNPDNSQELNNLSNNNPHLNITKMDVTSSKSILKASENFKNEIDILVCNAGVNNGKGDIFSDEHNENAIMEVMMVNVGGPFLTIQNLYKNLNKKIKFQLFLLFMCVLHAANIPLATTILPPRRIDVVNVSLKIIIPIIDAKNNWK